MVALAAGVLAGCIIQDPGYRSPPVYREPQPEYVPPQVNYGSTSEAAYGEVDAGVRVVEAPPPLPEYEQPPCPEPGYLWTPGYWGYGGEGYFWCALDILDAQACAVATMCSHPKILTFDLPIEVIADCWKGDSPLLWVRSIRQTYHFRFESASFPILNDSMENFNVIDVKTFFDQK